MTLPIKGPFRKTHEIKGPPNKYGYRPTWAVSDRRWYTQAKPFDRPLPFSFSASVVDWVNDPVERTVEYTRIEGIANGSRWTERVYRTAYGKFLDKARGDASDLLTLFCERARTADMISDRATKLWRGLVYAKKGDLKRLKQTWGNAAGIKRNLKKGGGHVLEYSFGWAPLASDIANSVNALRQGSKTSGKVSQRNVFTDLCRQDYGSSTGNRLWNTEIGTRIGWELSIDHPSIALLDQLGLVNPAATAWELLPWSFVFDYWVNTNDVISSMTALAGCTLHNQWVTTRKVDKYFERGVWNSPTPPSYAPLSYGGKLVTVTRTTTINAPSWGMKSPWNLSWSRASTSMALLLQQLR